jgi:hypothetical protein
VDSHLEAVSERIASIEIALRNQRRNLSDVTKREHLPDIRLLGGHCPCCGAADVVTDEGTRCAFAEFDHFYANSLPTPDHTWLICKRRHTELTTGRVPRDRREAEVRPDFDSTWIRGGDFGLRNKDIGAPCGNAVYLGAQARWRIGGGV